MNFTQVVIQVADFIVMFRKRLLILLGILLLIVGYMYVMEQEEIITFKEFTRFQLTEESEVKHIRIKFKEDSENLPGLVTIKDEDIIQDILKDFSTLKLKGDRFYNFEAHDKKEYYIQILVDTPKEGYILTESIDFDIDEEYLRNLKIISNPNHLRTIESLIKSGYFEVDKYE
ncbi:hypothetical protein ACLM5H_00250 [Fredinandcohnia humi]